MAGYKTKADDICKPECEAREYSSTSPRNQIGRSPMTIVCPWCFTCFTGYLWSLCGSGKRCQCGAWFGGYGMGYKMPAKTPTL